MLTLDSSTGTSTSTAASNVSLFGLGGNLALHFPPAVLDNLEVAAERGEPAPSPTAASNASRRSGVGEYLALHSGLPPAVPDTMEVAADGGSESTTSYRPAIIDVFVFDNDSDNDNPNIYIPLPYSRLEPWTCVQLVAVIKEGLAAREPRAVVELINAVCGGVPLWKDWVPPRHHDGEGEGDKVLLQTGGSGRKSVR